MQVPHRTAQLSREDGLKRDTHQPHPPHHHWRGSRRGQLRLLFPDFPLRLPHLSRLLRLLQLVEENRLPQI